MDNNNSIRIDVTVISPCTMDVQYIAPKFYQSYNLNDIGDMKMEDMMINNMHLLSFINHVHYEIDIPTPCILNHETVKKHWRTYVSECQKKNVEIDHENKMNKRIPYEKYCAEQENKGSKPCRLEYLKYYELTQYGYKEQSHVTVPDGEVVAWSVVQEFK